MNNVILVGRLSAEPELKTTSSGAEFPLGKKSGSNQQNYNSNTPYVPATGLSQQNTNPSPLPENDVPLTIDDDLSF